MCITVDQGKQRNYVWCYDERTRQVTALTHAGPSFSLILTCVSTFMYRLKTGHATLLLHFVLDFIGAL